MSEQPLKASVRSRPILNNQTTVKDFRDFYWLKAELEGFCRANGLSPRGSKIQISKRIENFLAGEAFEEGVSKSVYNTKNKKSRPAIADISKEARELTPATIITQDFRCSQIHRKFFKSMLGPHFHFSTFIQNFFRDNVGKTFQDAIDAWHSEEARKKDKSYKTNIAPQFEYNQFIRDYFSDPQNKNKKRQDAIAAWKIKRSELGSNKYFPDEGCH